MLIGSSRSPAATAGCLALILKTLSLSTQGVRSTQWLPETPPRDGPRVQDLRELCADPVLRAGGALVCESRPRKAPSWDGQCAGINGAVRDDGVPAEEARVHDGQPERLNPGNAWPKQAGGS